jgi:hypothetical protein
MSAAVGKHRRHGHSAAEHYSQKNSQAEGKSSRDCPKCVPFPEAGGTHRRLAGSAIVDGFDHQEPVAAVRVVARQALRDDVADLAVELLRAGVDGAHFEPHGADVTTAEALFDAREHPLSDAAATVFGRDAERRDVTRAVGLDQSDDEADERAVRRDRAIGN